MHNSHNIVIRTIAATVAIFFAAILFRLWFITLAPQPFIYDQGEYERYAAKIFSQPHLLASHSYRSYPLPLMEAVVYKVSGWANHQALYKVHAVLDALVAVMVFILLKEGMRLKTAAWIGYILYAFNPFTSGYVGTGMSEILATFFITGTLLAGMFFFRRPSVWWGIAFGFFAGMAAETRNAAFMWAAIPILLTLLWIPWKRHVPGYVGIILGLVITVLYPLYTNWRDYREINITKVDNFYVMEFFNGASLKILPPFTTMYPKEQYDMWQEYWSEYYPGRTTEERQAIANKYFKKGWDIVKSDPIDYIRWRFFKMWYVWQKENLFSFAEPGYELHRPYTYWGNLTLLILAVLGMITGFRLVHSKVGKWIWSCFVGTIVYGTIAFCFSHAEYRLTIPFYPIVIALASIGIFVLFTGVRRIVSTK